MVIQYKCQNCGADLKYDSKTRHLKCDSCGKEVDIESMPLSEVALDDKEIEETEKNEETPEVLPYASEEIEDEEEFEDIESEEDGAQFFEEEGHQYFCKNCGAVVITTSDTSATNCSFCGAPVVLSDRLSGELAPARIIPFLIGKDQAAEGFRKWCKNGLLTPKNFKAADRIKSITGMYVPFWLYDMAGTGEADATATKVRTYTKGDYIYTETSYFHVYRRVHLGYKKVPVDASEKMNDTLMDKLEPFDYMQLRNFKMPYLAGYLAEKYNYDDKQLLPRCEERVKNYADQYLRSTINGYTSVQYHRKNISLRPVNTFYTLLPVWMVCYDYKDSEHVFAMNGQTGKIVGKPPLSAAKMAGWFAGISAACFALMRLITIL